ncbi:hypothetical protein Pelo_17464 [Pelomyxa schiedti]|nr:hypothetical protein Pelo_17464 [Pelomyxa schiedti]
MMKGEGALHGRRSYVYDTGSTYEGEWRNEKRDGWGVYRRFDGEWFEGLYRADRRKRGTCHSQSGVDVWDGEWVWNDAAGGTQMQGWGVQRRVVNNMGTSNGGGGGAAAATVETDRTRCSDMRGSMQTVYEGEWEEHKWHGRGTWHSPDGTGDMYHGQFDHGKRSGYGSILFGCTGGSYVGGWKDDVFHGKGARIWGDGTRYVGDWIMGKEHGSGTKTWACDGTSIEGVWEMGVIVSGTQRWPNGDEFTGTFTMNGDCGKGMATFRDLPSEKQEVMENKDCAVTLAKVRMLEHELAVLKEVRQISGKLEGLQNQLDEQEELMKIQTKEFKDQEQYIEHTLQHIQHGMWAKSNDHLDNQILTNQCEMKKVEVTLEKHNITFQESFCSLCPLEKVVKMEVEKRFGVDENQQVVSLVGVSVRKGDDSPEMSLSGTSSTLSLLSSLVLPHSAPEIAAQLKVRLTPVMTIPESHLSLVSTLGSGCYGTVYKYIHTPSSREVAVKTLLDVIASPHNVERFRLEAEIVSGLRHPNIVKCLGTCTTTSGKLQIVSELMCCSLRQLLNHVRTDSTKQRLTLKEVVSIALGVANGMDGLHRQNYMHRDLSSNNVLFDSNGNPKICDFGVHKGVSRGMQTVNSGPQSIVPGTAIHMAPQMFTTHYGIEGDVWGFGILVTEIINCGIVDSTFDKLPLHSQAAFLEAQMRTLQPHDVDEVRKLCSEAGESAIAHCLSRRNACLDAVNYFTHSTESPLLLPCGTVPTTITDLMFLVVQSCLSILERNRIPFTVIAMLLHSCCISATMHDNARAQQLTATTIAPVAVTEDQVTENIGQWLSSLSPFIRLCAAGSSNSSAAPSHQSS